jgi:hypothetical protein
MHDLLTGAIAGNLAVKEKRKQMPEEMRLPRPAGILRGAAALAVVAVVAVMIGFGESGGAEMAALATF